MPEISYSKSTQHIMKNVQCNGTELSLLSCIHAGFSKHYTCKESVSLHCEAIQANANEDIVSAI